MKADNSSTSSTSKNPNGFDTLATSDYSTNPPISTPYQSLHDLIKPHLESFNSIFDDGLLDTAVNSIEPRYVTDNAGNILKSKYRRV